MEITDFVSMGPMGGYFNTNLYYEPDTTYGVPALIPTPGTILAYAVASPGSYPVRGMLAHDNVLYCVMAGRLYSFNGATFTLITSAIDSTTATPVWMAVNAKAGGHQIAIVDGQTSTKIFLYPIGGSYSEPALPAAFVPCGITYQDTFFIVGELNGRRLFCSNSEEGLTWDPSNFATKEGKPDTIQQVISSGQELWVLGKESTEIWYYTGAATGFPFARIQGGLLNVGCAASASVTILDNSVFWLNDKCEVCRSQGYSWQVVSPPQLNKEFQYYQKNWPAYVAQAIAYSVVWQGHPWFVIHFPYIGGATWVYDIAAAAAGQQGWFKWQTATDTRHPSMCSALYQGIWRLGDYNNTGYVWNLTDNCYSDYGNDREYVKYSKYMAQDGKRIVYHDFSLRQHHTNYGASYIKNGRFTQLNGAHSAEAVTLTVDSSVGFLAGDVVKVTVSGGFSYNRIASVPGGGVTLVIDAPGLSAAALDNAAVWLFDYYSIYPQITLSCTSTGGTGYSGSKTTIPESDPIKWSALGSSYDNLFKLTYRGAGKLELLGASVNVTVARH